MIVNMKKFNYNKITYNNLKKIWLINKKNNKLYLKKYNN